MVTKFDLEKLFIDAYVYAEKRFGKKPNIIEILEDGTLMATWRTYLGCDDWETIYEHFNPEEIN